MGLAFLSGREPASQAITLVLALWTIGFIIHQPRLGILGIVVIALVPSLRISTGTDVDLYPVVLAIPAVGAVYVLNRMLQQKPILFPSSVYLPLLLFLVAGLFSLGIGNVIWDPSVPKKDNFVLVQLAQWAIFAFSAGAFWLTAALADNEVWLKRMTFCLLLLGGCLAVLRVIPTLSPIYEAISSGAVDRAPFWMLLAAMTGGQLLFNRKLAFPVQMALVLLTFVILYFVFFLERQATSYWVGVIAVLGVLFWLRFPRTRFWVLSFMAILILSGSFIPALWTFAGGEAEWILSGDARLTLIERVVTVSMRNPLTGLGPASYRPYADMTPLFYRGAYWVEPLINSHNNYIDLFAHVGILGLSLLFWFVLRVGILGVHLHRRYVEGFAAGYVNGVLAAGVGSLVIMMLADWILPFIYNMRFYGFQASVLVWLFIGGLVAYENLPRKLAEENTIE